MKFNGDGYKRLINNAALSILLTSLSIDENHTLDKAMFSH